MLDHLTQCRSVHLFFMFMPASGEWTFKHLHRHSLPALLGRHAFAQRTILVITIFLKSWRSKKDQAFQLLSFIRFSHTLFFVDFQSRMSYGMGLSPGLIRRLKNFIQLRQLWIRRLRRSLPILSFAY